MKRPLILIIAVVVGAAFPGSVAWAQESKETAPPSPPTTAPDEPVGQPISNACPTDVVAFDGTVRSSAGDQETKVAAPADCPGPRLYTQSVRYSGGDGDAIPEPGEKVNVFVTLQNLGHDPATDVSGTMKITSGDVTIIDGNSSWPDIAPGSSKESATPFVVQIAQDASRNSCGGIAVVEGPPAEASGSGSSSGATGSGGEQTVSSDGTVTVEPAGSASAEPGSVEPQPAIVDPEPGSVEPAPNVTEPAPQHPSDGAVDFQGDLTMTASGLTLHTDVFNGFACLAAGAEKNQTSIVAPVAARDTVQTSKKTAAHGSALYLIVVLVAAAGSLAVRYRFNA